MGTSLTVHPFASLTQIVPEGCPRVLVNMDRAGDIGTRPDDVLLLGKSDEIVRELCEALGEDWVEELDAMWKETEKYTQGEAAEIKKDTKTTEKDEIAQAKALHDEVDKLTEQVEKALKIGHVPQSDEEEVEAVALGVGTPGNDETSKAVEETVDDVQPVSAPDSSEELNEKPKTSSDKEEKPVEGKL